MEQQVAVEAMSKKEATEAVDNLATGRKVKTVMQNKSATANFTANFKQEALEFETPIGEYEEAHPDGLDDLDTQLDAHESVEAKKDGTVTIIGGQGATMCAKMCFKRAKPERATRANATPAQVRPGPRAAGGGRGRPAAPGIMLFVI